jgi:hypothetical protein
MGWLADGRMGGEGQRSSEGLEVAPSSESEGPLVGRPGLVASLFVAFCRWVWH